MNPVIGLDLGSTAIKAVIVNDGEIIWRGKTPTAPDQEVLANDLIGAGLRELGLPADAKYPVASTGYGKSLYKAADLRTDELSANARGLFKLSDGMARSLINIGGQDLKTIKLSETGEVSDFRMNDKCAAGTGRFFELAARLLNVPLSSFAALSKEPGVSVELNSTCVVFAESEIVSLLARGVPPQSVVRALHASVARRAAGLLGRISSDAVWLDGGPAQNRGLVEAMEEELLTEIKVTPEPQFTVAYGAAISLVA
ncbi:MAG: acyl-CoA dehydratase activase [Deltaproteobacteria bacterium]|jgi:predicted CoA-substrate-specific enzyme activase|nr:acyl-CoA dehydratase activase [Deltaproteobacteria bacterium]